MRSRKRPQIDKNELLWKQKYEHLVMRITDIEIETRSQDYEAISNRAFVQANRVYVSFHLEVVDSLEKAEELWGPGNFDVYDLNKELSPEDPENDGQVF